MRLSSLFLLVLLISIRSLSQTQVSGVVTGNKSKPIYGVSISLKDSYDGATTDSTGKFSFKSSEKGEQVLLATAVNYKPFEQKVKLDGGPINVTIVLKEEITELQAVMISAGTFEASDRKRAAAVLDPIDIVTTASANGDITGALKTLPGAQQVGESEGLFVRGGTAAETKIFIDGTLVNNFFFTSTPNIAQPSRFSPFLFKGTVFSTGGYSALYGQALSSALILESIDLPETSSASIGLTVLSGNAGFQQLSKKKNFSYGINYGYTNLNLAFKVIKQKQDYSPAPISHNLDANFRVKTSATGMLKYYGYFNSSKLGFTTNSIDSLGYLDMFSLKNSNFYHNLAYKENLGLRWKFNAGIVYSNNQDNIHGAMQDEEKQEVTLTGLEYKRFHVDADGNYFNAKAVFERKLKGLSALRFGAEYNYSKDDSKYTAYNNQQFNATIKEQITSVFAESDIYLTNKVAAKVGVRGEHSELLDKTNIAPRASLAYKLAKGTQASLAYGIFYQNPERKYLPAMGEITFMKATHYIAQFQRIVSQQTFRTELFYKKYEDLVKTNPSFGTESAVSNAGFGDAKGIEFFWRDKKTIKNLDYWISYSYLDTKRDYLNFPYATTPNFAAKHTASLILKRFVTPLKMNLNGAYNFASGRPYYNIMYDGSKYNFSDMGKIPAYQNVSFSINYLPFIGKKNAKIFPVYVFQVSNIFNIKQTYGYQYSYNGYRKEAIVPPSRMFVFIGAFISFGIDRSDDVINGNL